MAALLSCCLVSWRVLRLVQQNDKFDGMHNAASMVNQISCDMIRSNSAIQELTSEAVTELVKDYQARASGNIKAASRNWPNLRPWRTRFGQKSVYSSYSPKCLAYSFRKEKII
ncbi:hypothetical protein SLEP1_g5477 [Rubroshorea leprosula]|uniref:Uncharacterized protein n=1 Tax=Rubroshorea leprosula TaxID=152421 RepID=A0AAV5I2P3_9ROSI|nr:hypothetical protein SLEP1_g5477 [Rubroshorea leprosula]